MTYFSSDFHSIVACYFRLKDLLLPSRETLENGFVFVLSFDFAGAVPCPQFSIDACRCHATLPCIKDEKSIVTD